MTFGPQILIKYWKNVLKFEEMPNSPKATRHVSTSFKTIKIFDANLEIISKITSN